MQMVRVATFDGPSTKPQVKTVPQPEVPDKAALIQIGACGVCGIPTFISSRGTGPSPYPGP